MKNGKNKLLWLLIIPVVLVILYIVYVPQKNSINWIEDYKYRGKYPFGTYLVYELLKEYNNEESLTHLDGSLASSLPINNETPANYVFIGDQLFFGNKNQDSLLAFVAAGNTAFISSNYFPDSLFKTLSPYCDEWKISLSNYDSMATMNFKHPAFNKNEGFHYKMPWRFENDDKTYNWQGFNLNYFCDSLKEVTQLGSVQFFDNQSWEYINFIKIPHGKGVFYFHSNPIVFTNHFLKEEEGLDYANRAFSHLTNGRIFWDELSKLPSYNSGQDLTPGPLQLILKNSNLKTAWYLLLFFIFLYILFFAKRKQRIIPVLEQKSNTSLEFVKTIGALYFQQNQHRKLMKLKFKYFLSYIRHKYFISTNKQDEELIYKISLKSGVPKENIEAIFREAKLINRYDLEVSSNELINFHHLLENFYKNCK